MQLLYEVEATLRAAGFRTAREPGSDETMLFEDSTILGFVAMHVSTADIIERWRAQQDLFLRSHASALRRDLSKAWNTYAVFLTAAPVAQHEWDLLGVESDVTATRKIVRGGIITSADIRDALSPILPLPLAASTGSRSVDALFTEKLDADESKLFTMLRDRTSDERSVVTWLVECAP